MNRAKAKLPRQFATLMVFNVQLFVPVKIPNNSSAWDDVILGGILNNRKAIATITCDLAYGTLRLQRLYLRMGSGTGIAYDSLMATQRWESWQVS